MHIIDIYGLIALKMLYDQTGETQTNPQILKVLEKLRAFNLNPVFLTSERTNLNKL